MAGPVRTVVKDPPPPAVQSVRLECTVHNPILTGRPHLGLCRREPAGHRPERQPPALLW